MPLAMRRGYGKFLIVSVPPWEREGKPRINAPRTIPSVLPT